MNYHDLPKHWLTQAVLRDYVEANSNFLSIDISRLLAQIYRIKYSASSSLSEFSCTPVISKGIFGGKGVPTQYKKLSPSRKLCELCPQDGRCVIINKQIAIQFELMPPKNE